MPASGFLRVLDEQLQPEQSPSPDADAADGKGGTTEVIVPGGKTDKADEKQAAEKAKNDEKKNEKSDSKKGTQNTALLAGIQGV